MIVERAEKPWGYELLLAATERYAGKILCIRSGHRLSLQHHASKEESLFLLEGEAELELDIPGHGPVCQRMTRDRSYHIVPGQKHRLIASTPARILEISSPELDDVFRWEDDYGRASLSSGPARRSLGLASPAGELVPPLETPWNWRALRASIDSDPSL